MNKRTPILAAMIVAGAAAGVGLAQVETRRAGAIPAPAARLAAPLRPINVTAARTAAVVAAVLPAEVTRISAPARRGPRRKRDAAGFVDGFPGLSDDALGLEFSAVDGLAAPIAGDDALAGVPPLVPSVPGWSGSEADLPGVGAGGSGAGTGSGSGSGSFPVPSAGPQAVSTVPDNATWLTLVAGVALVGLNLRQRTSLRSVAS